MRAHLGEIEDVIDEPAEVFRGGTGLAQIGQQVVVAFLHHRELEQLAVTVDVVQGIAQLVADVGEELVLGAVRSQGAVASRLQLCGALLDAALELLAVLFTVRDIR